MKPEFGERQPGLPRSLISLAEAASLLSISASKLYRLAKKERRIPYIQYGPHSEILFDTDDVLGFFEASRQPPVADEVDGVASTDIHE